MENLDGKLIMIESFTPVDLKTFKRKKVSEFTKSLNIRVTGRFKTNINMGGTNKLLLAV